MGILETIGLAIAIATSAIGGLIAIYERFSKPDIKAANQIDLLKQGCALKHEGIDEKFQVINSTLTLIKENHLKHIEERVTGLEKGQERVITILDERLPKK